MKQNQFAKFEIGAVVLLIAAGAYIATAEMGTTDNLVHAAENSKSNTDKKQSHGGVLMLHSGKVVRGLITRQETGYEVKQQFSNTYVPYNHVKYEAEKIEDIYFELRDAIPKENSKAHLDLAKWCMRNELVKKAEEELRTILKYDPDNRTARKTLKELANGINKETEEPEYQSSASIPLRNIGGFRIANPEALGGYSPEMAQHFVKTIQPLMLNRCGNVRCHGGQTKQTFKLSRPRGAARHHRMVSEANLEAILKHVNTSSPDKSRLLSLLEENHGHNGRRVFAGPHEKALIKLMSDWVDDVAKESNSPATNDDKTTRSSNESTSSVKSTRQNSKRGAVNSPITRKDGRLISMKKSEGIQPTEGSEDVENRKSISDLTADDPFDPDVFNRKYGTETNKR